MTMMVGDQRECAKAVNAMMLQGPAEAKKADRQVEWRAKAYIFGHYDSRGGAVLVLADDHVEALKKYALCTGSFDENLQDEGMRKYILERGGDEAEYRRWLGNAVDSLQDDFIRRAELIVCDKPLPSDDEGAELDEGYCDEPSDGYRYGKVQSRYEKCDWDHEDRDANGRAKKIHTGKFSKWMDTEIFVMWKGARPPKLLLSGAPLDYEYRIVRESLGEDACGLCLVR